METASPSASLQPETNKKIIGEMLGLLNYEDKYFEDFVNWRDSNPSAYDATKWSTDWVKNNKPKTFINESTQGINIKTEKTQPSRQAQPAKDKLPIGYKQEKDGVMYRWDGQRFVEGSR